MIQLFKFRKKYVKITMKSLQNEKKYIIHFAKLITLILSAGDFVKFGFTMAFTTTILAWGTVNWPEAYDAADQLDEIRRAIKWSTDYFIKCHVSENVLYGQVGDFPIDHMFWGRPEELNTTRPTYKIDAEHPGSVDTYFSFQIIRLLIRR